MKTILFTMGFLTLGIFTNSQSKCTNADYGMYPENIVTPICDGSAQVVGSWAFTSDYTKVKLTQGVTYEFSATTDENFDPFITITEDDSEKTLIISGNGILTYTANADKVVRFYSHINSDCLNDGNQFVDRKVKCKTIVTDYCKPVLKCADGAYIKSVMMGGVVSNSACTEGGYNDYTDNVFTIQKDKETNFDVEIGYGWYEQSVSVWIDYNKNLEFEANEFIYIGTKDQGLLSKGITIPASVEDGEYRMRVRLSTTGQSGATPGKACDSNDTYGEVEDYTLKVVTYLNTNDNALSKVKIFPNPTSDVIKISSVNKVNELVIVNTTGQVLKTYKSVNQVDLKGLPAGIYILKIKLNNNKVIDRKIIKN